MTPTVHALLALALLQSSGDDTATWYDLRPIIAATVEQPADVDLRLHVSSSFIDALERDRDGDPLYVAPRTEVDLVDCIAALEAAMDGAEGARFTMGQALRGRVLVTGNGAAHAAAADTLRHMRALTAPMARVELTRVPAGALPPGTPPLLSPAEADALLAATGSAGTSTQRLPLDRATIVGSEARTAFVFDYDVEVAQAAKGPDPVVSVVRSGLRTRVTVSPTLDGASLAVRIEGRDGVLQSPIERIALPGWEGAEIELPECSTAVFASSGELVSGGALVIHHDAPASDALVVRVFDERRADPTSPVVHFGQLLTPQRLVALPSLSTVEPSNGFPGESDDLHDVVAPWNDAVVSLGELFSESLRRRDLVSLATQVGSRALMALPADEVTGLQRRIRTLAEASPARTVSYEVAYAMLPQAEALAAARGDLAAFAGGAKRVAAAGLDGDTVLVTGGIEHAYLQDHDLQIAGGSTISDPVVMAAFRGVRLWVTSAGVGPEGVSAWLDFTAAVGTPDERQVMAASYHPATGDGDKDVQRARGTYARDLPIELGASHATGTRAFHVLPPGQWTLLTCDPYVGTAGLTLVAAVRATPME